MTTTVYKVAKKLNTTSEEILEMIKNNEITYEKKNGIYYVDENEVRGKVKQLKTNKKNIISSVVSNWKCDVNNLNIHFDSLYEEFSGKGFTSEDINILSYISATQNLYVSKRKWQFAPSYFGDNAIVLIKDMENIKDGVYFVDNEYFAYLKHIMKEKYNDSLEIVISCIFWAIMNTDSEPS